jgi:hypothetical protein
MDSPAQPYSRCRDINLTVPALAFVMVRDGALIISEPRATPEKVVSRGPRSGRRVPWCSGDPGSCASRRRPRRPDPSVHRRGKGPTPRGSRLIERRRPSPAGGRRSSGRCRSRPFIRRLGLSQRQVAGVTPLRLPRQRAGSSPCRSRKTDLSDGRQPSACGRSAHRGHREASPGRSVSCSRVSP